MLEIFFSFGSATILVGMGFQSLCLIGVFDLRDVSVWSNAQNFVMCLWRVIKHFGCYTLVVVKICVDLCVDE